MRLLNCLTLIDSRLLAELRESRVTEHMKIPYGFAKYFSVIFTMASNLPKPVFLQGGAGGLIHGWVDIDLSHSLSA